MGISHLESAMAAGANSMQRPVAFVGVYSNKHDGFYGKLTF